GAARQLADRRRPGGTVGGHPRLSPAPRGAGGGPRAIAPRPADVGGALRGGGGGGAGARAAREMAKGGGRVAGGGGGITTAPPRGGRTAVGHPPLPLYVLMPRKKADERRPGLLAIHGHDSVGGRVTTPTASRCLPRPPPSCSTAARVPRRRTVSSRNC